MADEQLSFIIADLAKFTSMETVALAMDVQGNLQEDTPRDTGWARANWVLSTGAPVDDPAVAANKSPTPAQVVSAQTRQVGAIDELASYDISRGAIFTTNNVPYIIPLNEGHSAQAGAAFVQRAVGRALMSREARL